MLNREPLPRHPLVTYALPVYNEGESAARAVRDLSETAHSTGSPFRILVWDDGSTDGAGGLARLAEGRSDLRVLRHERNLGVGAFFRWCLDAAIQDARDEDLLVVLEGDATNDVGSLARLVETVVARADVAIGSRYVPGGKVSGFPVGKRVTSLVVNGVLRALYGGQIRDWTIFYRAYRVEALRRLAQRFPAGLRCGGFAANAEILAKLVKIGCRVEEVPQHYRYGLKTAPSKLRLAPHARELLRLVAGTPPFGPPPPGAGGRCR